ncbi:uncharacterized protein LOC134935131 [Pseudophryne corroboree]|uniref:uncharacterized protein LOC134935131 n=1 Tax=Pseudophryne corroboree TaxID=495146 RepID=UPI003081FAC7
MRTKSPGYMHSLLLRISRIWPLKYMFKKKANLSEEVETVGSAEQISPNRRFLSGKKRIGRLARLIHLITPYWLQCALGYRSEQNIVKTSTSNDIWKAPLKLNEKGSKSTQDDLDMDDQHSLESYGTEDLTDETDEDDDPSYEALGDWFEDCRSLPNYYERDREDYKLENDTESDVEVEEMDGIVMLKEATQPNYYERDREDYKLENDTESDVEVEEMDGIVMLKEATQDSSGNEE